MPRHQRRSVSPIEGRRGNRHQQHRKPSHKCRLCRQDHTLSRCLKFKRMNVLEKLKVIKKHKYCENCLAHSHQINRCHNTERCHQCKGKHHTLLHRHRRLQEDRRNSTNSQQSSTTKLRTVTLLPTAFVQMKLGDNWANVRGILNPCVEYSSIAEFLVEKYKLTVEKSGTDRWCRTKIRSRHDEGVVYDVTFKIDNSLPQKLPKDPIDSRVASLYTNLRLADPNFYVNQHINFTLGADIYPRLIRPSIQPERVGTPMAQDTMLGWIIIGTFGV